MTVSTNVSLVEAVLVTALLPSDVQSIGVVGAPFRHITTCLREWGYDAHEVAPDELGSLARWKYDTLVAPLPPHGKGIADISNRLHACFDSPAQRMVFIIPPNVLFSHRNADCELRTSLLTNNTITASIMLPPKLLPGWNVPASALLLDKTRSEDDHTVYFLNAANLPTENLLDDVTHGRIAHAREHLRNALDYTGEGSARAHGLDLCVQGASLLASAHCLTPEQRVARQTIATWERTPLNDVACTFRPLLPRTEGGEIVNVLQTSQISPYGYTRPTPETTMRVERNGKTDQLLRGGDIILTIRGVLGKVGMLPPDFPSDDLWVANQSSLVLRPRHKNDDPRLLFLYLRSELGQEMLQSLNCGASVPMLQINQLMKLDVIMPDAQTAAALLDDFAREDDLVRAWYKQQEQCEALRKRHWTLTDVCPPARGHSAPHGGKEGVTTE